MTLLGDTSSPGGVTFAFTERTGGCSEGVYASLNLGSHCGDSPEAVAENRLRVLRALGASDVAQNLVEPKQVHGDHIVVVRSSDAAELNEVCSEALEGADGIVCLAKDVPVLLCFADCVPVVLVAPSAHAFAVVHSGWRGTLKEISAKAARVLIAETGVVPQDILAYIGPHICGADFEVSAELLSEFVSKFGEEVQTPAETPHLDLSKCIYQSLQNIGCKQENIVDCAISTATNLDRFYSYRFEAGKCGRHAAIAWMPSANKDIEG